jgi:uncharacterized protein YecE (DUF72 family)
MAGRIRAGIGGWTFEPWRGVFYPKGLKQADELAYASRQLTAIEVNATYHSLQKPESWAKWASQIPEDFVFTVKGSRYITNRKDLAGAGESMERFFAQGFTQLGPRLGPIVWQFMPFKRFDAADFEAFLAALPRERDGLKLRHALEVRHASFAVPEFVALCRKHEVAICCADHATYPMIPDLTADFVYLRLMTGQDEIPTGYPTDQIELWARRAEAFARGEAPDDLPRVDATFAAPKKEREVFVFFISEGKIRAPAAATALLETLSR